MITGGDYYIKVPTWDNGIWSYTEFSTKGEFRDYVKTLFKEPGKYEFDETTLEWNKNARKFQKDKLFCIAPEGSRDYQEFWDTEKEKCRKGVIYKNGDKQWYLPRDLYFWWNFLVIPDKIKKTEDFPEVWDTHYHMALYNIIAELHGKHSAILKKRQVGSSLYHMGKLLNILWFEKKAILKIGASVKDFINNDKGSWVILEGYRNFLNKNTGWYRGMSPDKSAAMSWEQKIQVTENGRSYFEGNESKITGTSFEKSPTAGVGGPCRYFFHEEAGEAPSMDTTLEFMLPALGIGDLITGQFIAAGSVGQLDKCGPLKDMILRPRSNSIYPIKSDLIDENGTIGYTGLFIPEQWSFPPHIDKYGNSLPEKALQAIQDMRILWEKGGIDPESGEKVDPLSPDLFRLRISQRPINIKEAFAIRKTSLFSLRYTGPQARRIEEGEYPLEYVDLIRTPDNNITTIPTDRKPCVYPSKDIGPDKRGCVVIHERPIPNSRKLVTYIGSVDPVAKGISQYSDSLASVYIYKMPVEVMKTHKDGTTETFMEGGKIVAWWTGRYDDVNDTNEEISKLVEYYSAYTTCEYNQGSWVNYMIGKRRQMYMALKSDMLFDSEMNIKQGTDHKYGWYKTTSLWGKLLEYGIDSLSNVDHYEYDDDGNITKIHYGVERITDIWLLKEMNEYDPKEGNYDRIIAYCALMAFAELRLTLLRGMYKKQEKIAREDDKLEEKDIMPTFKVKQGPFKHLVDGGYGQQSLTSQYKRRSPFRNL